MTYPSTLRDLQVELLKHSKDGRSDDLFRIAIVMDQIGSLTRHLTHDQKLNPVSRPHSSRNGEISDAGHALVQLMTYCALRGIDIEEAIHVALDNLREKDFVRRKSINPNECRGCVVCIPEKHCLEEEIFVRGIAISEEDFKKPNPVFLSSQIILIANHPQTEDVTRHGKVLHGIVTDNGGITCHAAIVAREFSIPCIVGTANATRMFKTGDKITMNLLTGKVTKEIEKQ